VVLLWVDKSLVVNRRGGLGVREEMIMENSRYRGGSFYIGLLNYYLDSEMFVQP
jgi:hypothetical protein